MNDLDTLIRPATQRDLPAIIDLWGEMMDEHQQRDPRVRLAPSALPAYRAYASYHLDHIDSCLRVAETVEGRRQIIGFCLISISRNLPMFLPERYGYLSDLAVAPAWRRHGVGRALFSAGIDWLRRKDVTMVQLQFYSFNDSGEAFWRAMGFEPYYTRMWLDL